MIYIFHGDDTFQSRKGLLGMLESKNYQEVKLFAGQEITQEVLMNFTGRLFFTGRSAIVLENLFSLLPTKIKLIIANLKKMENDIDFFIYEEKKLTPTRLSLLGENKKIFSFQIPATIFKLLDGIGILKYQNLVNLLQETLKSHPSELILFLLERRLREMLIIKSDPEELNLPAWQKSKLINQVKKINSEEIEGFYLELIETELKNKTGRLGNSLQNELFTLAISQNETNQ